MFQKLRSKLPDLSVDQMMVVRTLFQVGVLTISAFAAYKVGKKVGSLETENADHKDYLGGWDDGYMAGHRNSFDQGYDQGLIAGSKNKSLGQAAEKVFEAKMGAHPEVEIRTLH